MTRSTEKRRRSGIDPRLRRISTRQCKGPHAEPLRAEIILDGTFRKSILICGVDNLEPLPAIDINHSVRRILTIGNSRQSSGQRWVEIHVAALAAGIVRVRSCLRSVGLPSAIVD